LSAMDAPLARAITAVDLLETTARFSAVPPA
jgi:hypothetical protein